MTTLKAPFPYFGGKSAVAESVWSAFGPVDNFVEPFFGSGAVLLARPGWSDGVRWTETINDADGFVSNFWRALRADPDGVSLHADWPVNENDLEARHLWLVNERKDLTDKLTDPDFYDAKAAGWWVWGISSWIGSGWCSGTGPWVWDENKRIINRQRPHLGDAGKGLREYLGALSDRIRNVRVCCGDWSRVCGPSVTFKHGITGVFLDPPYTDKAERDSDLYAVDCLDVGHTVAAWCRDNGANPLMRIALCGYDGEYNMPGWRVKAWKASGGYENQAQGEASGNCAKERIWFSPHCVDDEPDLFA